MRAAARIAARAAPRALGAAVAAAFVALMLWTTSGHFVPQVADLYVVAQYARAMAEGHPFRYYPGDAPTTGSTSLLYTAILAAAHALGARGEGLIAFAILLGGALLVASIPLAVRVGTRLAGRREGLLGGALVALGGPVAWSYLYGLGHRARPLPRAVAARPMARVVGRRPGRGVRRGDGPVGARPSGGDRPRRGARGGEPPATPARAHDRRAAATVVRARRGARGARAAARADRHVGRHVRGRQVAAGQLRAGRRAGGRREVRRGHAARAPARFLPLRGADRLLARGGCLRLPAARPRVRPAGRARRPGGGAAPGLHLAGGHLCGLRPREPEHLRGSPLQPLHLCGRSPASWCTPPPASARPLACSRRPIRGSNGRSSAGRPGSSCCSRPYRRPATRPSTRRELGSSRGARSRWPRGSAPTSRPAWRSPAPRLQSST